MKGLQKQIEEMEKRLEFKSSLERSFDSLQVSNTGCRWKEVRSTSTNSFLPLCMVGRDQFPLHGIECRFEGLFSRPSTKPRWMSWLKWEGAQVLIQPRWTHTSRHDEWNQILDHFCHILMYWKLFLGHSGNTHLVYPGWSFTAETSFQASCSQPAGLLTKAAKLASTRKSVTYHIYACVARPNLQCWQLHFPVF